MKKNILKPHLFISVLCLLIITNTVQAQSVNKITISVKNIEYDDPNFTALRETLKKNPKVKLVKPSYAAGVAILSFTYAGEASQLWEEIPKTSKRFFNMAEMSDDTISLNYLNQKKNGGNSTVVTNPAQTKTNNKKDCFDCDYFPLCTYDVSKSYGGKLFHGIRNDDNSIEYYYCENGVLTKRWEYTSSVTRQQVVSSTWDDYVINYDDDVNRTASLTIMKSNVPVGTFWESKASENSGLYSFALAGKGIRLTMNGKTYSDVIKIRACRSGYTCSYHFYGRNVGYLGENLEDEQFAHAKEAWVGIWKLIKDGGRTITPEGVTEYLMIHDNGGVARWDLQKKSDDELVQANVKDDGSPSGWFAGDEIAGICYPLFFYKYWETDKTTVANKASIPKKLLIIGTKTYQFFGIFGKDYKWSGKGALVKATKIDSPAPEAPTYTKDTTTYTIVDSPAMFPGNNNSWTKYCERNLNLATPQDNGAPKGTYEVKIRFTVAKDGTTKDFVPLTNFKYGLEEELIRIIKKGPKWIPAKKEGKFVNSIVEQSQVFKVPVF